MKNPWLLFALLCGAIISFGLVGATIYGHGVGVDFAVLHRAARSHSTDVYVPDQFAPFVYPPTALLWLKPLALLSLWPAFVAWSVASLGLFLWAAKIPNRALLVLSPALVQCIVFGQTSLLVGALILVASRGSMMGGLFGIAFTIKPQLVALAPLVFLVRRDWQAAGGFAAAVIGSIILTTLIFGSQVWLDWLHALPAFRNTLVSRDLFWVLITPAGLAERFGLPPFPFWAAGAAIAGFAVLRSNMDAKPLIVCASLLAAPYAVGHDLVALLPFCLLTLQSDGRGKPFAALAFAGAFVPIALAGLALKTIRK